MLRRTSGARKTAEERRLKELREAERIRLQEVREVEEQRRADNACRREEKRLEQIRRDTPKMTPITPNSDVEECIELFEVYVEELQLEKYHWMSYTSVRC